MLREWVEMRRMGRKKRSRVLMEEEEEERGGGRRRVDGDMEDEEVEEKVD